MEHVFIFNRKKKKKENAWYFSWTYAQVSIMYKKEHAFGQTYCSQKYKLQNVTLRKTSIYFLNVTEFCLLDIAKNDIYVLTCRIIVVLHAKSCN